MSKEVLWIRLRGLIRKVNSLKRSFPCKESPPCLAIFDSILANARAGTRRVAEQLNEHERAKLKHRLEQCADSQQPDHMRQLAVMEVGTLAPPQSSSAVATLEDLVHHTNKLFRINACQSLSRIGGQKAMELLEESLNNEDPDVRRAAQEGLSRCDIKSITEELLSILKDETTAEGRLNEGYSNPNQVNCEAYRREEKALLDGQAGQFAAYHNGARIALGPDEDQVYRAAREEVGPGLIMIQKIEPGEKRRIVRFRSPRIKRGS